MQDAADPHRHAYADGHAHPDTNSHADAHRDAVMATCTPRPFYSIIVIKLNATGMTPLPGWTWISPPVQPARERRWRRSSPTKRRA